jgi:hypothetical protein
LGEIRRLRAGEAAAFCNHSVSVGRCCQVGVPGQYECIAITRESVCPHDATMRSARLLAGPSAGLAMSMWP